MEWLPKLYEQHKDWPELVRWTFVEAADRVYAETNRDLVSSEGLSVDGTSEFLRELAEKDKRVTYIPHGIADHSDPSLCKIKARQRYMEVAQEIKPEFVIVLDADEFYTKEHQESLVTFMRMHPDKDGYIFPRREIWRPPNIIDEPLFQYEAVGFFWSMPCGHWWRWNDGCKYAACHNNLQKKSGEIMRNRIRWDGELDAPQMIHMGFAACKQMRLAKNRYYEERGEKQDPKRVKYTKARRAWMDWTPMKELPFGGKVIPYTGPIPEVFQ